MDVIIKFSLHITLISLTGRSSQHVSSSESFSERARA